MQANAMLVEWSTKTISTFVAATVPVPKGKKNSLLKSAGEITLGLFGKGAGGQGAEGATPPTSDLNKFLTAEQIDAIVNRPVLGPGGAGAGAITSSSEAFQLQFGRHLPAWEVMLRGGSRGQLEGRC